MIAFPDVILFIMNEIKNPFYYTHSMQQYLKFEHRWIFYKKA